MLRASQRAILPFFEAIKNLRLRQVNLILKTGFDPNLIINSRGQNGLQYMVNYFNTADARYRIQAPIYKTAYLSIAKLLLDSGLDPNVSDLLTGESVAYDAVRLDDREMVSLLLHYIDFTHRNKNGETLLMCAARFGSKQTLRLILEHLRSLEMDGYFLRQRNRYGRNALELARENPECASALRKHLITFGHHLGPSLSRSCSHHQLRAIQSYHQYATRPLAPPIAAPKAGPYLDDSGSDYTDIDVLAPPPLPAPMSRASVTRAMMTGYNAGTGLYDPKADQFNQYLLEQQQELGSNNQLPRMASFNSDSDDFFGSNGGGGGAQGQSGLTRSRSCMLGPSAGNSGGGAGGGAGDGKKYGSGSKSGKNPTANEGAPAFPVRQSRPGQM